jgi:hypothetical protein
MKPHSRPYLGLIFCSLLVVGSLMGMGGTESALSRTPFHPNLLRASIPALRYARPGPLIIRPAQSGVSRPASWVAEHWTELVPAPSEADRQLHEKLAEMLPLPIPREKLRPHYKPSSSAPVPRPPASSPQPAVPAPPPGGSFEGLNNYDNVLGGLFQVLPPDVNGDVGPNHYVEFVNLVMKVYSKGGTPLSPPFPLSAIFASAGFSGPCATANNGDPIVLYDQFADRWFLSQFYVNDAINNTGPSRHCIAISQTGNPLGAYYVYEFIWPDFPAGSGTHIFMDYPHHAVWWPDTYWMTAHEFDITGTQCPFVYCAQAVVALERNKMLVGDPTAQMVYFGVMAQPPSGVDLTQVGGVLAADIEGPLPIPLGSAPAPGIFLEWIADEYGAPTDAINVYKFTIDWSNPSAADFVLDATLPVAAFDPRNPSGRDDIPQPGVDATRYLDSISDRFMHRVVIRNRLVNSVIGANHTVCAPGLSPAQCTTINQYRAAVRWYILNYDNNTGAVTLADQGTYTGNPPDTHSRWMASVTFDKDANFCVSYTVSSTTVYPSIRYACRAPGDPPGTLGPEAELQAGSASQTHTASRWGDYSMISIDPTDECTFWPIHEYFTTTNPAGCSTTACWHTRFGFFKFPSCTGIGPLLCTVQGKVTNLDTGAPVPNAVVWFAPTGTPWFGFSATTNAMGTYTISLPPSTYDVYASAAGYVNSATVTVNCTTSGGFVNQNFALDALGKAQLGGFAVLDTCPFGGPGNGDGIIDPGETVVLVPTLQNVGPGNLTGATGTLSTASPDITITDASGAWPNIPPGGAAGANNPFGFNVSGSAVCGSTHAMTLNVTHADGTQSLPLSVQVGVVPPPILLLNEDFSGGIPATWTVVDGGTCSGLPVRTWNATNPCGRSIGSPFATPFAIADSDCAGSTCGVMDEQLITPSLDASSCTQVVLEFSNQFRWYSGGQNEVADVDVSVDGGTTWTNVLRMQGASDGYPTPNTKTVDITAQAAGHSNVKIRFHYYNANFEWWWAIDNVKVTCHVPPVCNVCAPPSAATPTGLSIQDPNNNGVWDSGEAIVVAPAWTNNESAAITVTGTASNVVAPPGVMANLLDPTANYGSIPPATQGSCSATGDCYVLSGSRSGYGHADVTFDEALSGVWTLTSSAGFVPKTWTLHMGPSFADVAVTDFFYRHVETLLHRNVTGGCTATTYCPTNSVNRAQMAIFISRAVLGTDPPAVGSGPGGSWDCTDGLPNHFTDVPDGVFYCPHVHWMWANNIAGGCTATTYCPSDPVTRAQMAVFISRAVLGGEPPAAGSGPCSSNSPPDRFPPPAALHPAPPG